jgi:type IV secretion system protein VirB9
MRSHRMPGRDRKNRGRAPRLRQGWWPAMLGAALWAAVVGAAPRSFAEDGPDRRLRVAPYAADRVYRLTAYVGYQIDLEFEPGERFVGLGAGDLAGLRFAAQDNHLFLKPRAPSIDTNLTVLTNRRSYQFEYSSNARRPDPAQDEVVYALRFTYAAPEPRAGATLERRLETADPARAHNLAYAYRGSESLKPQAAWDDGVQTRLRFGARGELPAIFVRNDDGSESLVNFSIAGSDVIVHRVAAQFVVRRGRLRGCIINQQFDGAGTRLKSGTVAPTVERALRDTPQ